MSHNDSLCKVSSPEMTQNDSLLQASMTQMSQNDSHFEVFSFEMTQNDSFSGHKCPTEHPHSVADEPPATPPSPQNDTPFLRRWRARHHPPRRSCSRTAAPRAFCSSLGDAFSSAVIPARTRVQRNPAAGCKRPRPREVARRPSLTGQSRFDDTWLLPSLMTNL